MTATLEFTAQERHAVELLAQGYTPVEAARIMGVTSVAGLVASAMAKVRVRTVRALVYVSQARERIDRPGPPLPCDVDDFQALVWAGTRLDMPDAQLAATIAAAAHVPRVRVEIALADLCARLRTNRCGLIRQAFRAGVLSGIEGHELGVAPLPAVKPQWAAKGRPLAVLKLTASGLGIKECAGRLGITAPTVVRYLRQLMQRAEVLAYRPLIHSAVRAGILKTMPRVGPLLSAELVAVWRGLVLDVPDGELIDELVRMTGFPRPVVAESLARLRSKGIPDCRLVVLGWECGVITAATRTNPVHRDGPLARRRLVAASPSRRPARGWTSDPLNLLPAGSRLSNVTLDASQNLTGVVTTGREFDLVRVSPAVCHEVLDQTRPEQWGPVLGIVSARTAVLITKAGALGPAWRGRHGRLWVPEAQVSLPATDNAAGTDRSYWAVTRHARPWDGDVLRDLLDPTTRLTDRPAVRGRA
ncbi:hypothetical protein [Streptomyces sp. NPDC002215]|uniref:hypothetical protein n=1 Tax=Streptomyces sp. NPDC002215 TaxID=3154412 RepID=UPI003322E61C